MRPALDLLAADPLGLLALAVVVLLVAANLAVGPPGRRPAWEGIGWLGTD